jgi:hypothetical protein
VGLTVGVYQTEMEFVGCFWREAIHRTPRAFRCIDYLPAEAVGTSLLRQAYLLIAARMCREAALSPSEGAVLVGMERSLREACDSDADRAAVPVVLHALSDIALAEHPNGNVAGYAKLLWTEYHARLGYEMFNDVGMDLLELGRGWDDDRYPHPDPGAVLRRLSEGAMEIHAHLMRRAGHGSGVSTGKDDLMDAVLADTDASGGRGYRWPWPKLQRMLGTNIQPGGVYGFTGRPGGGKSLLGSNLWRTISVYAPVLPAMTEMPRQWITRGIAAEAQVEQQIAELGQWDARDMQTIRQCCEMWNGCSVEQARVELAERKRRFRLAAEAMRARRTWDYIGGRLTLEQLFAGWRMLRSHFPGRQVVGILDHAHHLNEKDIDLRMPEMMSRLKEFCEADPDGFSAIVFFQPRKLGRDDSKDRRAKCRPVYASEISGNAEAVLDTHASVFRQWVEIDHQSPPLEWGQQPCKVIQPKGIPVIVPEKEFDKWTYPFAREDNEHVYLEADKTRVLPHYDGPQVKRIILNCCGPYGTIFEASDRTNYGDALAAAS